MKNKHFVFTLTTSRSGTQFLSNFLETNLDDVEAYHELVLGFDKFGVDTPDISHLHTFNSQGNTPHVKNFWKSKFEKISETPFDYYVETSHILMKAGLVENLELLKPHGKVYLVALERDILDTIKSLINTSSFVTAADMWLWFLDQYYPRNIVDPKLFPQNIWGFFLWYIYEIKTRAEYYKLMTSKSPLIKFLKVDLYGLNNKEKASKFLKNLGADVKPASIEIPPPLNIDKGINRVSKDEIKSLKKYINELDLKPSKLAKDYIDSGRTLG